MDIDGYIQIYKLSFGSLPNYELIIELYKSCLDGLELKPFKYINLVMPKVSMSQIIEYQNNIFRISDIRYSGGESHRNFHLNTSNTKEKEFFIQILNWIKSNLESMYPELSDGFVNILCLGYHRKKIFSPHDPKKWLKMNRKFRLKYKKVYGEKYIMDESYGSKSISRQNPKVFQLIKNLIETEGWKFPPLTLYTVPKFIIPYMEIKFENGYEKIHMKLNEIFYHKFYKLKSNDNNTIYFTDYRTNEEKLTRYDSLEAFDRLVRGIEHIPEFLTIKLNH